MTKMIKIAGINLKSDLVEALYLTKHFAINKTLDLESYSYTITHIETGKAVVRLSNKLQAIKLCNELNRRCIDIVDNKNFAKEYILNFMYGENVKFFHLAGYNY